MNEAKYGVIPTETKENLINALKKYNNLMNERSTAGDMMMISTWITNIELRLVNEYGMTEEEIWNAAA